jgi:putative transposase
MFVPGYPVHLVHRGNNRQAIFRGEADFQFFKGCLSEALCRFAVSLHCYTLMGNHIHLLLTPSDTEGVSRAMQGAIRRYVGYFNARNERTGTLWEGRFHATRVESDAYLLACHRYIELNPVRAGVVRHPVDYRWSSHRRLAYGLNDPLVVPHPGVAKMGQAAYARLFDQRCADPLWDKIRQASQACQPLSDEKVRKRGRPRKMSLTPF